MLRVAWLCQAPFEWGEHVENAKRIAQLTSAEIQRVKDGGGAAGWGDEDRAIVTAVDELLGEAMISEETWEQLALFLDSRQLIELPILVGQYLGITYLQNSLRCPLLPGNIGLLAQ